MFPCTNQKGMWAVLLDMYIKLGSTRGLESGYVLIIAELHGKFKFKCHLYHALQMQAYFMDC